MNTRYNRFHIITLFFSVLLCTTITAEYSTGEMTVHLGHQTHSKNFTNNKSHHDFSHNRTWDNTNINKGSTDRHNFSGCTVQNFQQHFTARGYTEKQILNQRCLYMFNDFVKFAQTYSSYKCTIQQLHAELKNLNIVQKAYCIVKGTYCPGLQKRIHFLYNQLSTLKNEAPTYTTPAWHEHSLETFPAQHAEYKALEATYNTYTPSLSNAIEKRVDAYKDMTESDYAMRYASKSYNLNNNGKQLLSRYEHDTTRFTQCYGNQLHHAIHQESLNILERIDSLPSNSILHDHQEALIDFTVAMVDYNHEGLTDKAMDIGDLCWTLLDYGQAVAEGAVLGAYSAATDILNNPIQATISIVAGKQVLAYQLSKVLYNVADIGVTAITDFDGAKNKWDKYAEPLNNTINAIYNKEITVRDAIKNGTAFVVGYKVQGKLLGGLGKFCNTIRQKSINFVKDSAFLTPQEYLTTPEGLLFKATAQSNKFQQPGQNNSAANLQNSVEKLTGTVWNNIKPTDPMYLGTKIPKSFELTVGKEKFWVCPNSTEHMLEYIQGKIKEHKKIITHNMPMNCQSLLTGFKSAVEQAVSQGIKYDTMIRIDCWEFRFGMPRKEGLLPTIYHANFKPQNW
jgi:hypothetical protein